MFMPTRLQVLVSSESTSGSQIKVGHPRPIADQRSGRDDEESQDERLVSHYIHVDRKFASLIPSRLQCLGPSLKKVGKIS